MLSHHFEMKMQQDSNCDWQYQDVNKIPNIETETIENNVTEIFADQGPGLDIIHPQGERPVCTPVPGQNNAGGDKQEYNQKLHNAREPIEFAWAPVCLEIEHHDHVREYHRQQDDGGPAVHVPDEPPEDNLITHVINAFQGLLWLGIIEEKHKNAGAKLEQNDGERKSPKAVKEAHVGRDRLGLL